MHKCARCSNMVDDEHRLCQDCTDAAREHGMERRHRRKAAGLCTDCGRPALPGRAKCQACADRRQERYYRYKAQGRCITCGQPAVQGKTQCPTCAAVHAESSRNWQDLMRSQGRCTICGRPAGYNTLCWDCAIKRAEYKRNRRIDVDI